MASSLPEAKRSEMEKLAKDSGLPYATILGQHIYDLKGLESVLCSQLERAKTEGKGDTDKQVVELCRKLKECQEQIAAFEQEQQGTNQG
ncbi:MAG TPA: hypothetical protein VH186_26145 [Chloroflexia bacterium]|nr:hypothetical protein [Chloroflexia bacterium]